MKILYCLAFGAALLLDLCSCNRGSTPARYALRGEVVALDTSAMTLMVAHQAIKGFMDAMTMPFHVKDRGELGGLAVGDSIKATLVVAQKESYLEEIRRFGSTFEGGFIRMPDLVAPGEEVPDIPLINQDGATIHMSDFRGRVLALTFIYTRCPLPDFCIRMSENFSELQNLLAPDGAIAGKWHLLSVSFDARFDRPEVLARYGALYGARRATWDLATDPDTSGDSLRLLAEGLGLGYKNDEGLYAHNLRTALIDRDGRLSSVTSGNTWDVREMASEIRRLIGR
ncbi:MAG TPA: SCO family protein [Bacteroidota bacterium]|nr:SCO family protein [Bacteroidota bacterium]